MKAARWLLPLVSLLVVVWLSWPHLRGAGTGPGPLHPAHAAVPALAGGAACEACHRPGAGIDENGCLRCHEAIDRQRASGAGLHGALGAAVLARCERCHSEHHGDVVPLLAPHAFPRAGVADPQRYDHAHVPFALAGVHRDLACTRCHPHADDAAPPAGGRFLGLSQQCTACHADEHRGAFGGDCAACHGQERAFRDAPGFTHRGLPLAGAHARVACTICHPAGSVHDLAVAPATPPPARGCRDCHADPHGGAGVPTALRLPDAADCARCHAATAWRDARPDAAAHARLGFPLLGAHANANCASCHGDARATPRWTGTAPASDDCAACHAHAHGDALLAAGACAGCHAAGDATFAAGRITPAQHAAAGFPLAPPHAAVDCARCHAGATHGERFPGRDAADCRACHADPHDRQFDDQPAWRQCTACHAPTHFQPHAFGPAAHAATAFPLDGAHAAVGCSGCHRDVQQGVRRFHGTTAACADCHADVHRGVFDRPGRPRALDGRSGCARCHDPAAWAPVARTFEHGLWTGYELVGAHQRVACASCHPGQAVAPGAGRLGPAAGTDCTACHADPHLGQFARDGRTECARCHGATSWGELQFDHQRDSRFPLDATHRALPCSACHRGLDVGGRTVVRWRPLGHACGDCHRVGTGGGVR